jgi:hypothetical protein
MRQIGRFPRHWLFGVLVVSVVWLGALVFCLTSVAVASPARSEGLATLRAFPTAGTSQEVNIVGRGGLEQCDLNNVDRIDQPHVFTYINNRQPLASPWPNFVRVGNNDFIVGALIQNGYDRELPAGIYPLEVTCPNRNGSEITLGRTTVKVTVKTRGVETLSVSATAGRTLQAYFYPEFSTASCTVGEFMLDGNPLNIVIPPQSSDRSTTLHLPSSITNGIHLLSARCPGESDQAAAARGLPISIVGGTTAPSLNSASSTDPVAQPAEGPSGSFLSPHVLGWTVPPLSSIITTPTYLIRTLLLALALVFLIGFPAELVNKTIEENREVFRCWFAKLPAGVVPANLSRWLGVVGFVILGGLSDAIFDSTKATLTGRIESFLTASAALILVTITYSYPTEAFTRIFHRRHPGQLAVVPAGFALAVICGTASFLARWNPAYLYGLFAAYLTINERRLTRRQSGSTLLAGAASMLAISCLAITSMSNIDADGVSLWLRDFLAKIFVLGILGLMFALMPIRYLDGYKLRRWSWRIWALAYLVISLLFIHVLVTKNSSVEVTASDISNALALFIAFGIGSILFWAFFLTRKRLADKERRGRTQRSHGRHRRAD